MANFLFCSLDAALIGDVAWQVHREGHDNCQVVSVRTVIDFTSGPAARLCGFV